VATERSGSLPATIRSVVDRIDDSQTMRSFTAEKEVAMFTLHSSSHLRFVRDGIPLCWVLLAMTLAAQAQTQADCTFNFFSTMTQFNHQDGTPVFMQPLGINDFSTIVGYAIFGTSTADSGLIRWTNGGVTRVKGTSGLVARNDHGTTVGYGLTLGQTIFVNGNTITPIVLDGNNKMILDGVEGINRWGTIVGTYLDNSGFPFVKHGFKRWNNGTTHTLDFPGATRSSTTPEGINDNGTVVGQYADKRAFLHGFIFHNGQWTTLDYPQALATNLIGITNDGKIIGKARVNSSDALFLYENGTFKVISVPHSPRPELLSISPKQGLILGITDVSAGQPAFIVKCQ
jgi:hypothetical protein